MSWKDATTYSLSSVGLLFSLTDIEQVLQIVVLLVTGIPATFRCYEFIKKKYADYKKL